MSVQSQPEVGKEREREREGEGEGEGGGGEEDDEMSNDLCSSRRFVHIHITRTVVSARVLVKGASADPSERLAGAVKASALGSGGDVVVDDTGRAPAADGGLGLNALGARREGRARV